ncbi:hypothetical protein V8J88_16935 [Massilia sp. W12]|uniref:hypothetical protein n=1 Tax=Massilia sp. W12 TaxID=3126507 RepID=UPI0030CC7780
MKAFRQSLLIATLFAGASFGVAAQECVGDVITPPAGMVPATDDALLASAIGAPGKGALCKGKVFVAEKPVTVYRVWDKDKAYTVYGRWWSFDKPVGPREEYAKKNDICPEWSPLNIMSSCTIKVGTKVVVGPGQSATCTSGTLPASAVNQVYIPNDSRNIILFVENCTPGTPWP